MLLPVSTEPLETIIAYDELAPSPNQEVIAVVCDEPKGLWTQIERRLRIAAEDDKKNTHDWRQAIHVYATL